MINPIFLKTFEHLAQSRHFTRTAEALHMTQPGVSQHIRKLEQQLGQALIYREAKQFELTPAGDALLAYASAQARAEADLQKSLQQDDPHSGECTLACSGALALLLYPQLLAQQQQHPELSFRLEAAPNSQIIHQVCSGETELGITTRMPDDHQLQSTAIGNQTLCLVTPAGTGSVWEDLRALGFINHPDGHEYASRVLSANYEAFSGMESLPERGYVNQIGQILLPVSQGLGFTVLPSAAVEAFPDRRLLSSVSLPHPVNETLYLIHKRYRPLATRYHNLIRSLSDTLSPAP